MFVAIDVSVAEEALLQTDKILAVHGLLIESISSYADADGPFRDGFENLSLGLSAEADLIAHLHNSLTDTVPTAFHKDKGPGN